MVLVTGGDNGIGYAIAHAVAASGARKVVIANRNVTKGQLAAEQIGWETGADVRALQLDLSSLSSVRHFAAALLAETAGRLHLLVNNAGITAPSVMSGDGYELVFQVDYLGHFLLTEMLLPALRGSAPSRVVNLASGAHENACESAGWPADCFKDWTYLPPPVVAKRPVTVHFKDYTAVVNASSYGVAKFALIQHAAALARLEAGSGVEAYSVTPGLVLTDMTGDIDPSGPRWKRTCEAQAHPDESMPVNPCPYSASQGAAVVAVCAAQGGLVSGGYHSRPWACQRRPVEMQGFTEDMAIDFYHKSSAWVALEGAVGAGTLSVVV